MSANCDVIVYLEQLGKRIPDAQSAKLTFSITVTFYFTKNENRTIQILCKKYTDISKIKRALVLKGIFSETGYVCVITYEIASLQHNSDEFQTGVILLPPPSPTTTTLKRTPKKHTKIRVKAYNII